MDQTDFIFQDLENRWSEMKQEFFLNPEGNSSLRLSSVKESKFLRKENFLKFFIKPCVCH